jgi:hypothetical protein
LENNASGSPVGGFGGGGAQVPTATTGGPSGADIVECDADDPPIAADAAFGRRRDFQAHIKEKHEGKEGEWFTHANGMSASGNISAKKRKVLPEAEDKSYMHDTMVSVLQNYQT